MPAYLAALNPRTRTPLLATGLVTVFIAIFALAFPINVLAERTSQVVLVIFFMVNLALLRIKWRGDAAPEGILVVPAIVPGIGLITCAAMLLGPFFLE